MMGKSGVGRSVGSIALVLSVLMGTMNAFSYGSAKTHLEVTEAILGGYGGDDFREFSSRRGSKLIDTAPLIQ